MFYNKTSPSRGFIAYSDYGVQSHLIMNSYGVVFSVNPYIKDGKVVIFGRKDEAIKAPSFYDEITEVIFVAKAELY